MAAQSKTGNSPIDTGIRAAVWSGVTASGIGWAIFGLFGLFLFGDRYPILAGLGKIGLGLGFLSFPLFVPVAGLLSLFITLFILRKRSSLTLKSFITSFGVALLLLAMVAAAVNLLFLVLEERQQRQSQKARQEEAVLSQLRASLFKVRHIVVEQRGDIISIQAVLSGTLAGNYRATVSIADIHEVLMSEAKEISLPSNANEPTFDIPLSLLKAGFRKAHVQGSPKGYGVSVGPMDYRIKVDLLLLSSPAVNDLDKMLPAASPDRISSMRKGVRLELGQL